MANCNICKVQLDQPGKVETTACGGDCLGCMAEAGDPDAARTLRAEVKALRTALGAALHRPEATVVYSCPKCGSESVLHDAYVAMNDEEDVRIFDDKVCDTCGHHFAEAVETPVTNSKEN